MDRAASRSARLARLAIAARLPRVGRLKRQIRRAFIANAGKPLSTSQLLHWCYARHRRHTHWQSYNVRRAVAGLAEPLYQRRCRGMPWVWSLLPRQDASNGNGQ